MNDIFRDFALVDCSPPAQPEVSGEDNMFPFQNSHSGDKMHKLKSSQKSICREFITLTQTGEKTALYCLSQHDWKLEVALDNYFANPEVSLQFSFISSELYFEISSMTAALLSGASQCCGP